MQLSLRGFRCAPPRSAWAELRSWYNSGLGRLWLERERQVLEPVLANLFGYHLLQVGRPTAEDLTRSSRIGHRMQLDLDPGSEPERAVHPQRCVGEHHRLPILSDSLDVVVLPHTLEMSREPHEVLREVERTLIPEGHVVILGFNPLGLWGGYRLLAGLRRHLPWCAHFYTPTRVKDWLALLGFDTVLARGYFYRPPLQQLQIMERLTFLERANRRGRLLMAGGYVLVAKKRVATVTPIRPRWRPRRSLVGDSLAKPSVQRKKCDDPRLR